MLENRNLRLDLFALGLLAFVIFAALALLTYDPADPIGQLIPPFDDLYQADTLVHPPNETVQNLCGYWGALAADGLFNGLGLGAYYLVISFAALDVMLLRRRGIDAPGLRAVGWLASLIGITTLVALLLPGLSPGPVIGSGGHVGALGAGLLRSHFATAGALILAASLTLGGLLLCTDYVLVRLAQIVFGTAMVQVANSRGWTALSLRKSQRAGQPTTSARDKDAEPGTTSETGLRIRRKKRQEAGGDLEEEELSEETAAEEPLDGVGDDDDLEAAADEDPDAAELAARIREVVVGGVVKVTRADEPAPGAPPPIRHHQEKAASTEREQVREQLDEAVREDPEDYELPPIDLLIEGDDFCFDEQDKEVRRKAKILEKTFADFGFKVKVVEIETGPVIAQFEVQLEAGLRLSKITGLADDLAIALRVPSVRIVAPIPGKNTVGIEVPNEQRQIVRLREVIEESDARTKKMRIPLFLGKDVAGNAMAVDLSTLPHLLIAGRTGTGKSVCLNAIISSILMTRRPDEVRMLMIDPKMVELSGYGRLPHLMHPVVTDMRKAEAILAWAVDKMEERYALLARAGVRHLTSYNQLGKEELIERLQPETEEEAASIPDHLPFIVIVADEMADLMMTSGKEVEQHIIRLAQKSRAVGIHLILATQKPTVDVITGLIKSNLPARIAFQVASRTDSRVVLDENGADKLLGNGDMLFLWPGTSTMLRGQGTYLSDDEINAIVEAVSQHEQHFVNELVNLKVETPGAEGPGQLKQRDELYESAVDLVVREGRGSVSLLQRSLGVGYGRAARLIDFMCEDGFVGPYAGSQAREVLLSVADWERMQGNNAEPEEPPQPAPRRSKKAAAPPRAEKPPTAPRPPKSRITVLDEEPDDADAEPMDSDGERTEQPASPAEDDNDPRAGNPRAEFESGEFDEEEAGGDGEFDEEESAEEESTGDGSAGDEWDDEAESSDEEGEEDDWEEELEDEPRDSEPAPRRAKARGTGVSPE